MKREIRINNLFLFFFVGLFGLLWGIIPPFLWAAPSISSVSGTVSDRQTITVGGSGFGANGPTIKVFDDFEKGTNGSKISTVAGSAQVGQWDLSQSNTTETSYSTDYAHGGTQSARFNYNYAGGKMPCIGLDIDVSPSDSIFFSWWQYLPVGKDVPGYNNIGCNWKIFWLYHSPPFSRSDYASAYLTNTSPVNYGIFYPINDPNHANMWNWGTREFVDKFKKGEWCRYWLYMKAGQSSDGEGKFYQMNASAGFRTIATGTNVSTQSPNLPWNHLNFPGFARDDVNSVLYYEDIYVATGPYAQARVEIGNNATYSGCTNLTILTPTLWSDTTITATVRQGSFTNGSSAFLFVFDANGAVNTTGYPITIWGNPPPAPPTGIRIVN